MVAAIELKRVSKHFKEKIAVNELSLRIEEGSVVALLGPNGAGKTTTLKMMLGLLRPTAGSVRLLNGSPKERGVRGRIGAMLQEVDVIDDLKVEETINLFRGYYTNPLSTEDLLRLSGLMDERRRMASFLSGGQKRHLGFALALAGGPEVIFLDEPTVGMDVDSRQLFWDTIRSFSAKGRTIVLTTHYLEEADHLSDRVIVIDQGRIITDGAPGEIKSSFGIQYVSFTCESAIDPDALRRLPIVTDVEISGRRVKIYGPNTDDILKTLIRGEWEMKEIEINKSGLEEAFQLIVSRTNQRGSDSHEIDMGTM